MGTGIYDLFATAGIKTKIAAICFALAKLFFFLTIMSTFVSMNIAVVNLIMYVGLVIASAVLCIMELVDLRE